MVSVFCPSLVVLRSELTCLYMSCATRSVIACGQRQQPIERYLSQSLTNASRRCQLYLFRLFRDPRSFRRFAVFGAGHFPDCKYWFSSPLSSGLYSTMGCIISTAERRAADRSKEIERQLRMESEKTQREVKLLLLGKVTQSRTR